MNFIEEKIKEFRRSHTYPISKNTFVFKGNTTAEEIEDFLIKALKECREKTIEDLRKAGLLKHTDALDSVLDKLKQTGDR